MPNYVKLGCIRCEDRVGVVKTKNGFRCEVCGFAWQLDKATRAKAKPAPEKPKG